MTGSALKVGDLVRVYDEELNNLFGTSQAYRIQCIEQVTKWPPLSCTFLGREKCTRAIRCACEERYKDTEGGKYCLVTIEYPVDIQGEVATTLSSKYVKKV